MKIKSGLYLCKIPGKNYGLHLIEMSARDYIALKLSVMHKLFEGLNPFFQSDSDPMTEFWKQKEDYEINKEKCTFNHDYLFIEFWSNNYDLMLEKSIIFAKSINTELLIEDF